MAIDKAIDSAQLDAAMTATADAIREKAGNTDACAWDASTGFADAISAIQAGGGGEDVEVIKAFETPSPTNNVLSLKYVAPVCEFTYDYAYTNSSDVISAQVTYGEEGTVYVAAVAVRNFEEAPQPPDGWEQVAWIHYATGDSSKQSLQVLRHKVTSSEAGVTVEVSLPVISNQRNYMVILCLGSSDVDCDNPITFAASNIDRITPQLFEHTLLFCSSAATMSVGEVWKNSSGGFIENLNPPYTDASIPGGRLAAKYIPFMSQQPFESPTILVQTDSKGASMGNSAGVLYCALSLEPGTPTKYEVCV